MKYILAKMMTVTTALAVSPACAAEEPINTAHHQSYHSIYWSDGDSGKLGSLKFRIANADAPETGSLKQRGGAKCEAERVLGYEAKDYMVGFTKGKTIRIERNYGEDRYGRLVVDLSANGIDVVQSGIEATHLKPWPHKNGRAQSPKPDWCAQ